MGKSKEEVVDTETGEIQEVHSELETQAIAVQGDEVAAVKGFFGNSETNVEDLVSVPTHNWDSEPVLNGVYLGIGPEQLQAKGYSEPIDQHYIRKVTPDATAASGFALGAVVSVPELASLDVLQTAQRGNLVQITFLGMKKGAEGRTYRQFAVRMDKKLVIQGV